MHGSTEGQPCPGVHQEVVPYLKLNQAGAVATMLEMGHTCAVSREAVNK